jgi:4-amino-4-deoxy-L-arabinose transferase-like glycosyltransferase
VAEEIDGLPVVKQEAGQCSANAVPGRLGWKATFLILAFGGTLLGICLGSTRVLTVHEVVFAQPAREMVHTGDWGMIRFAGIPSTHKPPLTHWLIALSMLVFHNEAEWVCRLPSVLAAILTAWIVAQWAARSYGRRVGLLCGLIQLTAFYTLMQARLAEADMLLCLLVTAAMALFAIGNLGESGRPGLMILVKIAFFAVCGLAFLAKSVIGPVFILCGCGLYALVQRRWSAVRFLLSPVGWLAFLAITLPWLLWAYNHYPAILHDSILHTVGRFQGQLGRGTGQGILFYVYMMPAILLPWTPWAVRGIVDSKKQGLWGTPQWRLLFAWVAAGFVILTVSAFKAKHYAIPLMPPFSIATAWFLDREAFVRDRVRRSPLGGALLLAVCSTIALLAVQWKCPAMWTRAAVLTGLLAPLLWLALWFDSSKRPVATLVCLFIALWVIGVDVQAFLIRDFDSYRVQTDLARQANALTEPDVPIYLVDLPEDQITFYLRFPLIRIDDVNAFAESAQAQPGSARYVVTTVKTAEHLASFGSTTRLAPIAQRPRKRTDTAQVFLQFVPVSSQASSGDKP